MESLFELSPPGHLGRQPEGPARDRKEEAAMYIGAGTVVLILIILLVIFLIRR